MTNTIHSCSPFCQIPQCVMRREFEAWSKKRYPSTSLTRYQGVGFEHKYESALTRWRWETWQAATAHAVPPGWVVVPLEPTVEMKIAGDNAGFWCADKYRAMIAAAPPVSIKPEVGE